MNIAKLSEGKGLASNLEINRAVWHHTCYAECSSSRLKREQAKFRKRLENEEFDKENAPSPVKTRRTSSNQCLFCNGTSDDCVQPSNEKIQIFIEESAKFMKDSSVQGRLAATTERFYHTPCYESFKSKVKTHAIKIKEDREKSTQLRWLKLCPLSQKYMTDLASRYSNSLKSMGVEYEVHTTRLKERILAANPDLEASGSQGKEIILTFKKDLDKSIRRLSSEFCSEADTKIISQAASLIRKHTFQHAPPESCDMGVASQVNSTCKHLQSLVRMIINGGNAEEDENEEIDSVVLTLSQLIHFNAVKLRKNVNSPRRHDRRRETPFPIYLGLKLYGETRSKELITAMHRRGLCIGYDRVQAILTDMANRNMAHFKVEKVVCPPAMKKGLFTTGNADNLDHNTSSTFAKDAFHGTAITLTQHPDSAEASDWNPMPDNSTGKSRLLQLPNDYSVVYPCDLNLKLAKFASNLSGTVALPPDNAARDCEEEWLAQNVLNWSSYHGAKERESIRVRVRTVTAVLPLFKEHAHTTSMMLHSMTVVQKATYYLNPTQVAVLVVDQPLYAICMALLQLLPDAFGENGIFIMMGGLHVEMCFLSGSGWAKLLVEAEIFTDGRAEAIEKGCNVTRSRYAYEVTAAVLFSLLKDAYDMCGDFLPFDEWCEERRKTLPQFAYWEIFFRLILKHLQFVRSIRTANFSLFVESFSLLMPWFFALDNTNYARWGSVHLRDLINLDVTHPGLAAEFKKGHFVGRNSSKEFSAMALDQVHEQMNAKLKGSSGMIGLTESPDSLLKWMLAGADVAAVVEMFECGTSGSDSDKHHNDTPTKNLKFQEDFQALKDIFEEKGNPFLEEGNEVFNIATGQCADKSVVEVIFSIEQKGQSQYEQFVKDRLENNTVSIYDPIPLNKFSLMKGVLKKKNSASNKITSLKNDCSLFSRLWIANQIREGDMKEFFMHENASCPPSLSVNGVMRSCKKSEIVTCLTNSSLQSVCQTRPAVDAVVLDGAAIVHMIRPCATDKTFSDYVHSVENYLQREAKNTKRIDMVFDVYKEDSLKNATREKRGEGIRTKVTMNTKLPRQWPKFLRDSQNKDELFNLLAKHLVNVNWDGKIFAVTNSANCLTNTNSGDVDGLAPCNHEEADTRLMLHAKQAATHGFARVMVRTTDSDVVVLSVWATQEVSSLEELWLSYGTGKNHCFIAAHEIATSLGPQKCRALPTFHAFSGCDTVSSFSGVGKKSVWEAWDVYPEASLGFEALSEERVNEALPFIEKFVVTTYSRNSKEIGVNGCREELFKRGRQIETIPPTADALLQHMRRAAFQSFVWTTSLVALQDLPNAKDWGWKLQENNWLPVWWRTLPEAGKACRALISCKCKQACTRCSCRKATEGGLACTALCTCPCPKN
ncbi:hypothetical protein FOCC_FOCC014156 [Frankliniella occidentalis]|nr:hypothetical protein FOCC_FOCC014156 [Frankliniella occidentalis]